MKRSSAATIAAASSGLAEEGGIVQAAVDFASCDIVTVVELLLSALGDLRCELHVAARLA